MVARISTLGSIMASSISRKTVAVGNNEARAIPILSIRSRLTVSDSSSVGLTEIRLPPRHDVVFIRVRIEKNVTAISGMTYVKRFEKSGKVSADRTQ
uniref:Uncharacterized protein n=1 Tax=Magallana gigas TaxID=29159 RepID=K1R2G0_MAGGI